MKNDPYECAERFIELRDSAQYEMARSFLAHGRKRSKWRAYWKPIDGETVARIWLTYGKRGTVFESEALAKLLTMAQKVLEFTPRLVIKNGAYLLIYSNGETLNADSGTFARTSIPLACETHKTIEEALESSSFKYYSSDDYRKADSEEKAKISA